MATNYLHNRFLVGGFIRIRRSLFIGNLSKGGGNRFRFRGDGNGRGLRSDGLAYRRRDCFGLMALNLGPRNCGTN